MGMPTGCNSPASETGKPDEPQTPTEEETGKIETPAFARGADISWYSEMVYNGKVFRDRNGQEKPLPEVLKSLGMNAVRLRVWCNPDLKWNGTEDVVNKAIAATKAGLAVMIDFHYSNFFADPGRQNIPDAWKGLSLSDMGAELGKHTTTVLQALKDEGITPAWIQVGNETRNGMLWDVCRLWNNSGEIAGGWAAYAKLSNVGYTASKAVFPDTPVIIHLNNAWENNEWWFKRFLDEGGKMDIIGLSHYPMSETGQEWKAVNSLAIKNIKDLSQKFNRPVMVCEIGVKISSITQGKACIQDFMDQARKIDKCVGVFYWEPEVYGGWKPAIYNDVSKYVPGQKVWNAYEMGAFLDNGQPTDILAPFAE